MGKMETGKEFLGFYLAASFARAPEIALSSNSLHLFHRLLGLGVENIQIHNWTVLNLPSFPVVTALLQFPLCSEEIKADVDQ